MRLFIPSLSPTLLKKSRFSLHGHPFDVIQGRSGTPNYVNPPRRDVVGVKGAQTEFSSSRSIFNLIRGADHATTGSTVIIRFTTDNPGPW